jgi:iron complex outermembrane recepter protein
MEVCATKYRIGGVMVMRKLLRCALLLTTACAPALAHAQTNSPQTAPPESEAPQQAQDTGGLPELIVTARKFAERLQDVPASITAFDASEIQSARIESLADVAKLTPGLNFTPLFGRQNQLPIIRGAAQTFGQLNVGVFLDGVYLPGKAGVDIELNDLERVEIIRGPQSALYGRNTFAGAINYITKRPSDRLTGRGEFAFGDNGLLKAQASVSGPISDSLRVRVGAFGRQFDGFYRSAIDGGRVDFEKSYGGIATIEWQPVEPLTVTLRATYSKDDLGQPPSNVIRNNSRPGVPAGAPATQTRNLLYIGELPAIPRDGVLVSTGSFPGLPGGTFGDREENIRVSGVIEYDMGSALFTSVTAYSKRNSEFSFDGDNTICDRAGGCPNFGFPFAPAIHNGANAFALSSTDGYFRDISQEFRFQSPGGQTIDWLFGLFYYDNITASIDRGLSPTATAGPTAYTAFNPLYTYPDIRLTTQSYAAFGSATWNASERLSITGELRYEYEKQGFTQCPTTYFPTTARPVIECSTPSPVAVAGSTAVFDLRQDFRFLTPRIILNYRINPDALVYASYARGAKTGGFNTNLNIFADQRVYGPEYANNFEVGLKSDLFDRRVRFNVAAYYIDWIDQQAACQNPVTAGGTSTQRTYTCNVAAARSYGVETELVAQLTDHFSLVANYAYTNARYRRFVDEALAAVLVNAGLPPIDFKGKRLPYVPEHAFTISPRLNVPVGGNAGIEARADLSHQSRTFLRADNLQNFGERTVLDLRLTGRLDRYYLQLFANNVLDNDRPVAGVRFFDATNFSVASPYVTGAPRRQLGAAIGFTF